MVMNISLQFPWLAWSPEAKRGLPGTCILRLMMTFCQKGNYSPKHIHHHLVHKYPVIRYIFEQILWFCVVHYEYTLRAFRKTFSRQTQTIYIFFNRQEEQQIRTAWRWGVWSCAVFIDRGKHCLFYSNPTVDHEVFIPRLPVMKEVLCIM